MLSPDGLGSQMLGFPSWFTYRSWWVAVGREDGEKKQRKGMSRVGLEAQGVARKNQGERLLILL